jgi:DNA processing protein|tara:strand:+ start:105 stop:404 length:300 start_codon:yes stop_codon:yes gene_type:complete
MDDYEGLLRLNLISGTCIKTYRNLIEHLGSVKSILDCSKSRLEKIPGIGSKIADRIINGSKAADVDKEIKLAERDNVKIVPFTREQDFLPPFGHTQGYR